MDIRLLHAAIGEVSDLLLSENKTLATAESCTGGMLAALLTDKAGSSQWFSGSVVAYSNDVKAKLLGVPQSVLMEHGAVSEPVVLAMAEGALKAVGTDVAVSLSGIAGPDGGTPEKPVGTVWVGWADKNGSRARLFQFEGSRAKVRQQAVMAALNGLIGFIR